MIKKIILVGLGVLFVFGVVLAQEEPAAIDKSYMISPGDQVEVSVYGEPDLTTSALVAQDGTIGFPFLGDIKAGGLTVRELEKYITDSLDKEYIVAPQVTVVVKQFGKVSVLGQVRNPGSFEIKQNLTITQVIALAGGFTDAANTTSVKIIRESEGQKKTIDVNVFQILNKAASDIIVLSGDTIIIDEYGRVSIMGQVSRPGVYNLKKDMTVVEAISLAGGFTPTASQNSTRVIRIEAGKKKIIPVAVSSIVQSGDSSRDIILEPGDTIVVPESFF